MTASTYPVHVDGRIDLPLNRWLWLVKWVLAIPHLVVLLFLWVAFVVLSVVAFFAILLTGRYPVAIFEFNVGVLRWSWRVAYYSYAALGTDRYPPFSLGEEPDYPAHLHISHPEHLSRGLVLVKSWLLAIPHYVVVGFFLGGGYWASGRLLDAGNRGAAGGGLIGFLVLVAAVVLLFTGRYPQSVFDLVLGMNRWVLRVAAYASLMTDTYPPFRLDLGGDDPDAGVLAVATSPGAPTARPLSTDRAQGEVTPASPAAPEARSRWSAGRVLGVVVGSLVLLLSGGLLTGGLVGVVADHALRDADGFLTSDSQAFGTGSYAIVSENLQLHVSDPAAALPSRLLGTVRLQVSARDRAPVFLGLARTSAVRSYLAGVQHVTLASGSSRGGSRGPRYRLSAGGAPTTAPVAAGIWERATAGTGRQTLVWRPRAGDWTVVVMNAAGTRGVHVDASAGATLPALGWLSVVLICLGAVGLLISGVVVLLVVRSAGRA